MAPLTFIIPQPRCVDARDKRGHDAQNVAASPCHIEAHKK